jgi:4-amino-4-deoxy-L-arabinose transferase-like glycosyltransferase
MKPRWLLPALLVLALAVRFAGLGHEVEGRYYRDEGTYYHHATKILAGEVFRPTFVYPHFLYYADALVLLLAGWMPGAARAFGALYGVSDPLALSWLLLRALVALAGAFTVWPVFRIGERLLSPWAGALGGLFVIFSPLYNSGSHLNTCDVPAAFFATLSLAFVARLVSEDKERLRDYLVAGAAAGLAAASKYPAGVVAVAIFAAWIYRRSWKPGKLLAAAGASIAAFLACMPSLWVFPQIAFSGGRGILFGVRQYGKGGWLGVVPESRTQFYLDNLTASFGIAAVLLGVIGLGLLGRSDREARKRILALLPFPLLYLGLLIAMHMVVKRNLYPVLPALAAFLGAGCAVWLHRWRLAGGVLVVLALAQPAAETVRQDLALSRPSTREVAAAWIRGHLPPGTALLKEEYTPHFPDGTFRVLHRRFATRLTLAQIRASQEYVLLADTSYGRFLQPEALTKTHHHELADRYREILSSWELVEEWKPGPLRLGPTLRLYRVPRV